MEGRRVDSVGRRQLLAELVIGISAPINRLLVLFTDYAHRRAFSLLIRLTRNGAMRSCKRGVQGHSALITKWPRTPIPGGQDGQPENLRWYGCPSLVVNDGPVVNPGGDGRWQMLEIVA